MNIAELGEDPDEDFSAVIRLMERLARVETLEANHSTVASPIGGGRDRDTQILIS
jgi:hypothetical protein